MYPSHFSKASKTYKWVLYARAKVQKPQEDVADEGHNGDREHAEGVRYFEREQKEKDETGISQVKLVPAYPMNCLSDGLHRLMARRFDAYPKGTAARFARTLRSKFDYWCLEMGT